MTQANDSYDWEEILERLDVNFSDFPDKATLINRLAEALGRPASEAQIDLSVLALQTQRQEAAIAGYSIATFTRRGAQVTQLRGPRGQFVASTEMPAGATRSTQRLRVGDITAAIRRGAG